MITIIKKPGEEPKVRTVDNELEVLQGIVGGYIEVVRIATDAVLIVNEEGLIRGLPENRMRGLPTLRGTVIAVGVDDGDFCSLPFTAVPFLLDQMRNREEVDA